MALNLTAPFLLTQHVLPGMRQKGWGRIINVASVHGLVGSGRTVSCLLSFATRHLVLYLLIFVSGYWFGCLSISK